MRSLRMDDRNLKRIVLSVALCIGLFFDVAAQGRIQWVNTDIKINLVVLDNTDAPVEGASVYLVEKGDTLITYFTITDSRGQAVIDKITRGSYKLNIEMLGFTPVSKECNLKEREENLGVFKMQIDRELLEAAKITAAGNPIVVKQDTIVFLASAFATKRNATLKDMIKRFPGCEVSEEGTITVNGENVNRITVGGRTFFSGDNTVALNNLPAQIVEKVSVIDKQKESYGFTGIKGEFEKVMDVTLKKEYQNGYFGNAAVEGGANVHTIKEQAPMFEAPGLLYNSNALIAAYDSTTQVTVVGNLNNYKETEGSNSMIVKGEDKGLTAARQVGVNINTFAIKGYTADFYVNFSSKDAHDLKQTTRISLWDAADALLTQSRDNTGNKDNQISVSANIRKKDNSKYLLDFSQRAAWSGNRSLSELYSSSLSGEALLSESQANKTSRSGNFRSNLSLSSGIKDIAGRQGRTLTTDLSAVVTISTEDSREYTAIQGVIPGGDRDILYDKKTSGVWGSATLTYVEPVAHHWAVSLSSKGSVRYDRTIKDASEDNMPNDFLSAYSEAGSLDFNSKLLMQYSKGATTLQFGAAAINTFNASRSKSLGITTDMDGEWRFNAAPFLLMRTPLGKMSRIEVKYEGLSSAPDAFRMQPTIDLSNPSDVWMGNIYLKPVFRHDANVSFNGNVSDRFIQYMIKGQISLESRAIVSASWIDGNGTRYYFPVNSHKPGKAFSAVLNYGMPLTHDKMLRFYITPVVTYTSAVSYQNTLPAEIPVEKFNYNDFIGSIYGDKNGDRFYSGRSGFRESLTKTLLLRAVFTITYDKDNLSLRAGCLLHRSGTSYSLDSKADFSRLMLSPSITANYKFPKEYAVWTDFNATFRRGYSSSFNKPEYRWGVELSKNIGAFTLSLRGIDLLNSARNYRDFQTEDYVQETYGLMLGRIVLLGVKYNFGKMNAAGGAKATAAMLRMTAE